MYIIEIQYQLHSASESNECKEVDLKMYRVGEKAELVTYHQGVA